jgi:hypothetical protein
VRSGQGPRLLHRQVRAAPKRESEPPGAFTARLPLPEKGDSGGYSQVKSQYFSRYPRDVIYSDGSYTIIRDTAGTYLGYSTPNGVNNDGEIVGNYAKYPNSIGGFVYNGAYSFIAGFPGNSYTGVNDLGQVLGSSGTIYSAGAGRRGRLFDGDRSLPLRLCTGLLACRSREFFPQASQHRPGSGHLLDSANRPRNCPP